MVKVSIFYPATEGAKFDMEYYVSTHLPLCQSLFAERCKGTGAELGVNSGAPGTVPTYAAMGHLLFDSVESFEEAFAVHGGEVMSDVANYTDIVPVLQVSEVVL